MNNIADECPEDEKETLSHVKEQNVVITEFDSDYDNRASSSDNYNPENESDSTSSSSSCSTCSTSSSSSSSSKDTSEEAKENRSNIYEEFQQLSSLDDQRNFIIHHVEQIPKKKKYQKSRNFQKGQHL
uniref:Zinc finger CCHC domain-containing protein 10-like n=1 Tax=Diabrotica virgifera virgifera TaxID=50390 RepID=A0A6P7G5P5_DIAVI